MIKLGAYYSKPKNFRAVESWWWIYASGWNWLEIYIKIQKKKRKDKLVSTSIKGNVAYLKQMKIQIKKQLKRIILTYVLSTLIYVKNVKGINIYLHFDISLFSHKFYFYTQWIALIVLIYTIKLNDLKKFMLKMKIILYRSEMHKEEIK